MPRYGEDIFIDDGKGMKIAAHICYSGPRKKCHYCKKPHVALCDFEVSPGKTCDRPLCKEHAIHPPGCLNDIDYCPEHWPLVPKLTIVNKGGNT